MQSEAPFSKPPRAFFKPPTPPRPPRPCPLYHTPQPNQQATHPPLHRWRDEGRKGRRNTTMSEANPHCGFCWVFCWRVGGGGAFRTPFYPGPGIIPSKSDLGSEVAEFWEVLLHPPPPLFWIRGIKKNKVLGLGEVACRSQCRALVKQTPTACDFQRPSEEPWWNKRLLTQIDCLSPHCTPSCPMASLSGDVLIQRRGYLTDAPTQASPPIRPKPNNFLRRKKRI